jgi:hypothetical protein
MVPIQLKPILERYIVPMFTGSTHYGPAGDKQEKKCHFATFWNRTMLQ